MTGRRPARHCRVQQNGREGDDPQRRNVSLALTRIQGTERNELELFRP